MISNDFRVLFTSAPIQNNNSIINNFILEYLVNLANLAETVAE